MIRPSFALALAGSLLLSGPIPTAQSAETGEIPELASAALSDRQVTLLDVSKPDSRGKTFVAGTVFNAPFSQVCTTLGRFSDYPGFMPNVARAEARTAEGGATVVDMTLKLPLGVVKKYRVQMQQAVSAQACRLAWKLVPWEGLHSDETIADTTGHWLLRPHPNDARRTLIHYRVFTDPGPVPTGFGWIVDSMSKDSIPKMMEALRKRVG